MSIHQGQNDVKTIENAWKTQIFDESIIQNLIKNLSKFKNQKLLEVLITISGVEWQLIS
jgi:hypothetical protein